MYFAIKDTLVVATHDVIGPSICCKEVYVIKCSTFGRVHYERISDLHVYFLKKNDLMLAIFSFGALGLAVTVFVFFELAPFDFMLVLNAGVT